MATPTDSRMVTALFDDRDSAERAYESVTARGYGKDDVNLVMSDETRKKHFTDAGGAQTALGTKAAEGAGVGGAIGGTVGAIAAALAAALAGAGAGGAAGGLVGALIGWGIPEERVQRYESGIKKGGILMGVRARSSDDATYLQQEWQRNRGSEIYA